MPGCRDAVAMKKPLHVSGLQQISPMTLFLGSFPTENSIAINAAKLYDIYIKTQNIKNTVMLKRAMVSV